MFHYLNICLCCSLLMRPRPPELVIFFLSFFWSLLDRTDIEESRQEREREGKRKCVSGNGPGWNQTQAGSPAQPEPLQVFLRKVFFFSTFIFLLVISCVNVFVKVLSSS